MAIKKRTLNYGIVVSLVICVMSTIIISGFRNMSQNGLILDSQLPSTANPEDQTILIDKVDIFTAPGSTIEYHNMSLYAEYYYETLIEIVTPHNCTINMTIIDDEGDYYNIFTTEVNASQYDGGFHIPFGVARPSEKYVFIFSVLTELNLNIHIKVERGFKCLFDVMSPVQIDNLELYRVTKFHNGMSISHDISLRTDYSYKFYIGRVSPIAAPLNWEIRTDYDITDPEGLEYKIYFNNSLPNVMEVDIFDFGTARPGIHTIYIKIWCNVPKVNIAFSVVKDYKISIVDNKTGTDPPPNATLSLGYVMSAAVPAGLGMFGFVVIIFFIIHGIRRRRESSVKLA